MITKEIGIKKAFVIQMSLNQYQKGGFMHKETYDGRSFSVFHLIRDSLMLANKNISLDLNRLPSDLIKISEDEYVAFKRAFLKFPNLTISYSLNADSLKKWLGWYKIP